MGSKKVKELKELAKAQGIKRYSIMNKKQLINAISIKWSLGIEEYPNPNRYQCIHGNLKYVKYVVIID